MIKVWLLTLAGLALMSIVGWVLVNLRPNTSPLSEGSVTYWVRKSYFEELHKGTFV